MHILHFCGALKGGPLSAIAEWSREQLAAGHRVSLVYSPLRDPIESFRGILPAGVALHPLEVGREIHPLSDWRALGGLRAILRDVRPDILHLHSSKAGAIGRVAGRLSGIPTIYSTHGMSYLRTDVGFATRAVFYGMEWLLGTIGDVTVACSPSELRTMRAIPGRKIDIPNGIDLATLPAPQPRADKADIDIVLCGRITAQKNPQLACTLAAQSPPGWRWTWLGSGDLADDVTRHGRIAVAGWLPREETLARMGASDIMVHTSSWEGMPIAVLEGMAMSLPVVATDVVGNRDLVIKNQTGFVARDAPGLLAALTELASSAELRHRMGSAGRARILAQFDQAVLAQRWLALYAELAG